MKTIYLTIVLAPLIGAIIAGLFDVSRRVAHTVTIVGVGIAFFLSLYVFKYIVIDGGETFNQTLYTWLVAGNIHFEVGFLVDQLTATMLLVVTFVSWMVHFTPLVTCTMIRVINAFLAISHCLPSQC
ncbi:MAG: hypothetical protein R3E08_05415 [Thiotrichaceae bacterium]